MRKSYTKIRPITLLVLLIFSFSFSQNIVSNSGEKEAVICSMPATEVVNRVYLPPRDFISERLSSRVTPCASIEVTYNGFPSDASGNPGAAQLAFQFAVDIWETLLDSPVTIRINANFAPAAVGNLGSASPAFYATIPGEDPNTLYAAALAEKLIGTELNGLNSIDINCNFNSNQDWYLGTDGNAGGQFDFVTVVLHELGHGLGVAGFSGENNNLGYLRRESNGSTFFLNGSSQFNSIWDTFINATDIFGNPLSILNTNNFPEASSLLLVPLTSDNLTSNSPTATSENGGVAPKTFAPNPYNGGSSYSHWDEDTFDGTPHALMTPQLDRGEAIHDPGNVTLGFMEDMGWSLCQGSLSTDEFDISSVTVSPNPFTDTITLNLPASLSNDTFNVALIDINGRVILNQTPQNINGELTISDLSNLEASLYFLTIESTTSTISITKKIVKN